MDCPDLAGSDGSQALTALYDAHARQLHRFLACRLDSATADDLVAETFLRAWQQRHRYRPERASAKTWLYAIALNLARNHIRSNVRAVRAHKRDGGRASPQEELAATATERVHAVQQARRLSAALAALREQEREVLLLVAVAGLTPTEAASALDVAAATVRTRLHRARATLRVALEEDS